MDIPDEAIRAAAQARLGPIPRLEDMLENALRYELNKAEDQLEAAAPHIARAAQVAVLRELSDYWMTCSRRPDANVATLMWASFAARLKADELEAGAGQTGEES